MLMVNYVNAYLFIILSRKLLLEHLAWKLNKLFNEQKKTHRWIVTGEKKYYEHRLKIKKLFLSTMLI